ncbi:hypothetical protein LTR29_017459 [Friedmanniomyces endolithicus]|nr:hypothetical protein LTR29_017459 [Friedmanniomyces endolithicus]
MAGYPIFADYGPEGPTVDHMHERLHQHNSFLDVLARRKPNPIAHPNQPDVDFSDVTSAYLIDLEVPGLKDPNALTIQWLSWRHLVITGTTTRPLHFKGVYGSDPAAPLSTYHGANGTTINRKGAQNGDGDGQSLYAAVGKDSKLMREEAEDGSDLPPWLIIAERRIGAFRREFRFPVDVDMEKLDARLDAGLLHVVVPKKEHCYPKGRGKVKIVAGE